MKLFSTSCETLFLGWDAPLLPQAALVLRDRFAETSDWNLDGVDCVLPSAHSARRLAELLQRESDSSGLRLRQPRIMTIGQLAEQLYRPASPVALEFEQSLAWTRVLRSLDPQQLAPLIPVVPAQDAIGPWLELAGTLRGLHEELSASRMSFAEVAALAETDAERRRWSLLCTIQSAYLAELERVGLCDPHTSRRQAVLQNRCRSDRTVVLIGTSDLTDAMVEMLRALDSPLIAMVAAPSTQADRFDEFGCVNTPRWLEYRLPLEDHQLVSAGDMLDQSAAVTEMIAQCAPSYSPDQITVGVTDESQVGPIELELHGCGLATYRNLGWTIPQTAIGRLFDLTVAHLQRQTWQSLAALVRHADIHALISTRFPESEGDWLTELDHLLAQHFPVRMADPLPPHAARELPLAKEVGEFVTQWLACFAAKDMTISEWSSVVEDWLATLYGSDWRDATSPGLASGDRRSDPGIENGTQPDDVNARGRTWFALEAVGRVLSRFSALNPGLDVSVDGAVAIEMLSARLAQVRVFERPEPEDVEILGWLDLALDDAPAMVVNGLNHPFVPRTVTSDPFLPGTLRSKLPMADNDRRFARDVYAMQLMLSTRPFIRFVVGRSAADQSPTPPSRLLAAAEPRDIARRVRTLVGGRRETERVEHAWDHGPSQHQLPIPPLNAEPGAVTSMSVTAFRDYLTCPYRFYLRHVLKLKPLDDSQSELAANQFGDLIHGALELYGRSKHRDEADPVRIEKHLSAFLDQYASEHYTPGTSTAVQIQVAQARRRLAAVARAQASRIAEGWRIERVEASVGPQQQAAIVVDGEPMTIKGRFDRIDVLSSGGAKRWSILDYKTHGHPPEKKHLKKTEGGYQWIDLQLPLYRMMIPFLGIDAEPSEVALGYFNIGEKDEETRINEASFSEALMSQAEDLIRDCIRRIRAGDFRPSDGLVDYDDYGMILQTGVAGSMLDRFQAAWGEGAER